MNKENRVKAGPRNGLGMAAACVTMLMILAGQPAMAAETAVKSQPTVTSVKPKVLSTARLALIAKQRDWHKALINTPVPKEGCFKAEYPHLLWQEVPCVKPPDIPMPPRRGALADTVGNGYDYSAQVTGQLISVIGSFDNVTTTGEKGFNYNSQATQVADSYTLQLNSNTFYSPPACAGAANPATCQGWQQYVYSSKSTGSAFIQYWLIGYNNTCPTGWIANGGDCYRNSSSSITVPLIPATSLAQTSLTGSVTAGGNDRLDLATGGTHYAVTSPDNIVSLANYWNTAEFTIVGDCCYFSANFDPNTSIAVRATVHNGTTSAPACMLEGFTGETNNLNLDPTPAIGTQASPTLISDQASIAATPASCAVASGTGDIHIHTFTPTPQVNAPASNLNYDFQAEGEFILAKTDGGFEVQTRQTSGTPLGYPNTSLNQAIAAKIGNSVVVFSAANNKPQVLVNGSPITLADGQKHILPNDGDVTRHGNTYVARDMHGNSVQVIVQAASTYYLDVYVGLGRWPTNVQGLLVNAKNNVNAVVSRTGTVFAEPFNFSIFYNGYGDSWRVTGKQSLFEAASAHLPHLSTSNPTQPFDASHLAPAVYQAAKTKCQSAGVKQQMLNDCILDVAVVGDKKAALSQIHPLLSFGGNRANIFATEDILPLRLNK
jgi:hypothetical protein